MNNILIRLPKKGDKVFVRPKFSLFLFLMIVFIPGAFSQQVSLKMEGSSLESVLKKVGSQVEYVFFYKKEEVKAVKNISISLDAVPLKNALETILNGTDFEFEIFEKTIVLKKKLFKASRPDTSSTSTQSNAANPLRLLRGRVTDANNLPIAQVLVQELTSDKKVLTDERGDFSLSVPESGSLSFTKKKMLNKIVDYQDSVKYITVKMDIQSIELSEVTISSDLQKKEPARFVDMKNRNYMNLSQVLQGTVPGLSLQIVNSTSKEVTSVDRLTRGGTGSAIHTFTRLSVEEFLIVMGRTEGQRIIDLFLSGKPIPENISLNYRVNTTTKTTSALVPQIRGANTFTNNGANMLVVIDGFPQDGFPADYPMINVESIEVIKDQKELVKWGPRAAGGIILIKTKSAKKGKIQVNYTTNFYYSPAPKFSREKLQLASTVDYLDLLKDVDAAFQTEYKSSSFNLTPAKRLFAQNRLGLITADAYNKSLDSLKGLDNESQMELLQQDRFSQSHAIGLNGGVKNYKFNFIGTYSSDKSTDLNGYSKTLGFNLNNEISLLKNKLNITWLINYADANSRAGYSFSPNMVIEPYQMLLDPQGNYVYDYSDFSPSANSLMQSLGYRNHGVNILEDASVNRFLSRKIDKKTNFNARWSLLPGLTWSTSVYYTNGQQQTSLLYGRESSYVRRLVNTYGEYASNGVNFYVPYGDVLQGNKRNSEEFNLRSGLSFTKTIGKHQVNLTGGIGAASLESSTPTRSTIYGYNNNNGTSSGIFLPTPNTKAAITNFYSLLPDAIFSSASPYILTVPINGDTSLSRNVNANAALSYKYSDRLSVSGNYISVFNPLYGQSSTYSTSSNYSGDVTGLILKDLGHFVQNVYLSAGVQGTKLPNLPAFYSNTRILQPTWNTYSIWVNGLVATQQSGQSSTNYYQKLTFGLLDSTLMLNGAYNTQTIKGRLSSLSSDPAVVSANNNATEIKRFFSGGITGRFRKGLLMFQVDYSKSPEGQSQVNGFGNYDLGHDYFLNSKTISSMNVGFKITNISSYQGLGLMMGTNASSGGSFTQATNSDFSILPPRNTSYEFNATLGLNDDAQSFDLRYYNQSSSGLNNFAPVLTDPATGLSSRVTYSTIKNKGVEFFFKTRVVKSGDFDYNVTLNGAYNVNIADEVPVTPFLGADSYASAYRQGRDITNLWSVQSAGLNNQGDPQIYDSKGNITSVLDSATVVNSMVYSGVTRAPWTGGFIHEVSYKQFFLRAALTFNLGHVMRTYIPFISNSVETSVLIKDRWRVPGDEAFTDVPRISAQSANGYASFVTRNGTNSVASADNIRFQELMLGCNVSSNFAKKLGLTAATVTLQVQNLAVWTNNSLHVDPVTVSSAGKIGMPIPRIYSCNLTISF